MLYDIQLDPLKEDDFGVLQVMNPKLKNEKIQIVLRRLNALICMHEELVVVVRKGTDVAGLMEVYRTEERKTMIGYRIIGKMRSRGIATRAVRLLTSYLHQCHVDVVYANARTENLISAKVLLNNGYELYNESDTLRMFKHTCMHGGFYEKSI